MWINCKEVNYNWSFKKYTISAKCICVSSYSSLAVHCSYLYTCPYNRHFYKEYDFFVITENKMSGNVMLYAALLVLFSVVPVCALGKWLVFFRLCSFYALWTKR